MLLPLEMGLVAAAGIDAMSSFIAKDSDGVLVYVTVHLHVREEFIRAAQSSAWQVL